MCIELLSSLKVYPTKLTRVFILLSPRIWRGRRVHLRSLLILLGLDVIKRRPTRNKVQLVKIFCSYLYFIFEKWRLISTSVLSAHHLEGRTSTFCFIWIFQQSSLLFLPQKIVNRLKNIPLFLLGWYWIPWRITVCHFVYENFNMKFLGLII